MGDDHATLAKRMIGMIDLTDLADDHSPAGIDELCARAALHGTAAVCVWPEHVERCASELAGTRVRIATVVNFPSGDEAMSRRRSSDLDRPGRWRRRDRRRDPVPLAARRRHRRRRGPARRGARRRRATRTLKVILETGELVDSEAIRVRGAPGDRSRGRFRQDVDRQDPRQRHPRGGADDARGGRRRARARSASSPRVGSERSTTPSATSRIADDVMGPGGRRRRRSASVRAGLLDVLLDEIGST